MRNDLESRGLRVESCVGYLNDSLQGGATAFPQLGLEFRGAVVDALP